MADLCLWSSTGRVRCGGSPALGRRRGSEYERVCAERDELIERLATMNDPDREKCIAGLLEQLRVARLQIREWQTKYETVRRLRER